MSWCCLVGGDITTVITNQNPFHINRPNNQLSYNMEPSPTTRPLYNPYQWPPDMTLANLHARCSMPGKQNPDGEQCPCCFRREKLRTTNWFKRNLYKDFKYYGGGVSGYFGLLAYYAFAVLILIIICTIYHMICIKLACTQEAIQHFQCVKLFKSIKIMSPEQIRKNLAVTHPSMVQGLDIVYFLTFSFLLLVNFGGMTHLKRIQKKLTKSIQIFSHFSLVFKNIPRFMTIAQFRAKLEQMYPQVRIKEMFFLHKTAEYHKCHHKLLQAYYQLQYYRANEKQQDISKLEHKFIGISQELELCKVKFQKATGKAVVVFQEQCQKEYFEKEFKISQFKLTIHNLGRLLKIESAKEMGIYADPLSEPGEIIWKCLGDSSIAKTKVRIETGLISVLFLVICVGAVFYPIEIANTTHDPMMVIMWNLISATGLFILNLMYRFIMALLSDQRKPNTYLSRTIFIVLTTVFFHLLFYLYLPAIWYAVFSTKNSSSIKLRTLFFQVFVFVVVSIIIASIDFEYCFFKKRMKKHLTQMETASKFCQKQLHEKLNYPSFPIQFKLMIMYKIWSFVVFYTFQIPEILFLILPLMIFLYFGDKYRMYRRYKMNTYLPIKLEKDFEKVYIHIYIVTLCLSYLLTANQTWQYIAAPVLSVTAILLRLLGDYKDKKREQEAFQFQKTETISHILKSYSNTAAIHEPLFDRDSQTISITTQRELEDESLNQKTIDTFTSGYKQIYDGFIHHLQNKKVSDMLNQEYQSLKLKYHERTESEMATL